MKITFLSGSTTVEFVFKNTRISSTDLVKQDHVLLRRYLIIIIICDDSDTDNPTVVGLSVSFSLYMILL